jgi:hypothetical protein
MSKKKDLNNPKNVFKEKGGVELPRKDDSTGINSISSIRHSEITSIVPDEMNWSKIYDGKKPAPEKKRPADNSPK